MKVEAHEYAARPEITSRELRGPGQRRLPITRQSGCGLDRAHDAKHFGRFAFRDEHRCVGKQMRSRSDERLAEILVSNFPLKRVA